MAAPLRYPLILLAWGAMAAIYLPLLPAAGELVGAARSPAHWRALFADPQLGQALAATLVSTLLSVGGALLIALTIVAALWPSARWRRLASRLPLLLAVPHLALATAALLLFAEGGWLWQQLPFLTPPVDRYGIGLGLTMALKESAFVLWVIYGLLGEKRLADQATALKSLGYGRWQCLRWLVLPALLPALLARPEALLLDEPFSRLDASLRAGFRRWVFEELARQAIPAILVTHDREDCPPTGRCLAMERWQ